MGCVYIILFLIAVVGGLILLFVHPLFAILLLIFCAIIWHGLRTSSS